MLKLQKIMDEAPDTCLSCINYTEPDPLLPSWVDDRGSCSLYPDKFSDKHKCSAWKSNGARQQFAEEIERLRATINQSHDED